MEWNEILHNTSVLLRNQWHKQSLCSTLILYCGGMHIPLLFYQHNLLLYFKADDVIVSGDKAAVH